MRTRTRHRLLGLAENLHLHVQWARVIGRQPYSFAQRVMVQIASTADGPELATQESSCGTVSCICSDPNPLTERTQTTGVNRS